MAESSILISFVLLIALATVLVGSDTGLFTEGEGGGGVDVVDCQQTNNPGATRDYSSVNIDPKFTNVTRGNNLVVTVTATYSNILGPKSRMVAINLTDLTRDLHIGSIITHNMSDGEVAQFNITYTNVQGSVGQHVLRAFVDGTCFEAESNENNNKINLTITVNNALPSVNISHIPANPLSNETVTLSSMASDSDGSISQIKIYVNGTEAQTCSTSTCQYVGGPYPVGSYNYNSSATDNDGATMWSSQGSFTVTGAQQGNGTNTNLAPQWSNEKTNPISPATYSPTGSYQFNITWTDESIEDVKFEAAGRNYSFSSGEVSRSGDEYFISLTGFSAGDHSYKWYANDTNGSSNSTAELTYTINKAETTITLRFNGSEQDRVYTTPAIINISATKTVSGGNLSISRNGTVVAFAASDYVEFVDSQTVGTYNYTAQLVHANYTAQQVTRLAIVESDSTKSDLLVNSSSIYFDPYNPTASQNFVINATVFNIGNSSASGFTVTFKNNNTGETKNVTVSNIVGQSSHVFVNTTWNLASGNYVFVVTADSASQVTEWNETNNEAHATVTVSAAPQPEQSGGAGTGGGGSGSGGGGAGGGGGSSGGQQTGTETGGQAGPITEPETENGESSEERGEVSEPASKSVIEKIVDALQKFLEIIFG